VTGIIAHVYGETAAHDLQTQYADQKEMQKSMTSASNVVRMTHCQMGMHASIRDKYVVQHEVPSVDNFKLKRFVDNIDPKTSTKRGDKPFMSQK